MSRKETHHHDHDHDHDHGHSHLPPEPELRVKALETVLVKKGLIDPEAVAKIIDIYAHKIGPQNGAKVVAKAWKDDKFKQQLLDDATSAIASLGFSGRQGEHMVVVENTPETHNLVVCTLCSCYPWPVLGVPPTWYKSDAYRSRAIREPRAVLQEFGLSLPEDKKVKVWDSTAEIRYLVLPQQPDGTEDWPEEKLAQLVTRNSMIGTAIVEAPDVPHT
ncbi:MAG: nitrile hydratase subunit alpha [Alphaproteobacteria bacterium]|jgi:nitrile hydratase|nr:nitrile hydratase subunit alpha [Alphaproteobacteria bacterium]